MELRKVEGVSCIYKISNGGPYDLLFKINGNDRNELRDKVSDICNFNNIKMTVSLIIVSPLMKN